MTVPLTGQLKKETRTISCDDNDFLNCFMNVSVLVRKFTSVAQMLENKWEKIQPEGKRGENQCGRGKEGVVEGVYTVQRSTWLTSSLS